MFINTKGVVPMSLTCVGNVWRHFVSYRGTSSSVGFLVSRKTLSPFRSSFWKVAVKNANAVQSVLPCSKSDVNTAHVTCTTGTGRPSCLSEAGCSIPGSHINQNPRWIQRPIYTPIFCLLYTSPSPRDLSTSRMPSSA